MNVCLDSQERVDAYLEAFPGRSVRLGDTFNIAEIRCPLCFTMHDTEGQAVNCHRKYPERP